MEESYQAAVRRERTQSIQALNFELKYMIVGHITAFQGRNFWGTAVLWAVYKSILCNQKGKLFPLFFISLALHAIVTGLWFTSLCFEDPAFGKKWWHLILTGILSICWTLIRNRCKLRPCSWDHFKKDWHGFFSRHFQLSSRCLMGFCAFWYSLVLPNHLQV